MKTFSVLILMLIFVVSCGTEQNPDLNEEDVQKNERHIGKVIEKITASGYSYLQVVENKNEYWIAVPSMEIEVGETIYFSKFMVMEDFNSPTIEKTFDEILFVEDARKSPTPDEMKKIHSGTPPTDREQISIEPLADGMTIQQIYSQSEELNGKDIRVKGKVVKFNKQIMKRNWIHIQDGTGTENDFDLVLTTDQDIQVGDIIIAEGRLSVEKDFGAGYFFPVIIENAKIVKE